MAIILAACTIVAELFWGWEKGDMLPFPSTPQLVKIWRLIFYTCDWSASIGFLARTENVGGVPNRNNDRNQDKLNVTSTGTRCLFGLEKESQHKRSFIVWGKYKLNEWMSECYERFNVVVPQKFSSITGKSLIYFLIEKMGVKLSWEDNDFSNFYPHTLQALSHFILSSAVWGVRIIILSWQMRILTPRELE